MKIFFAGNYFKLGGPWGVNKSLVKCLGNRTSHLTQRKGHLRFLETLYKIIPAKVVIFSCATQYDYITVPLCKFLKKKIIYIMHGCMALEYKINNNTTNNKGLKNEKILLDRSDLILCVSNTYKAIICENFPQYHAKLDVLMNGIDWNTLESISQEQLKNENQIILMGGGRQTKRNLYVCRAIQNINQKYHTNYKVTVYGYFLDYDDSQLIAQIPCVNFHEVIPHQEILKQLKISRLFIQNSDLESFSLGVVEALCCGCDILISKNVGAKDIIQNIQSDDIINNPTDLEELENKILKVIKNGNNQRLLSSIDRVTTSTEYTANKLINFATKLLKN